MGVKDEEEWGGFKVLKVYIKMGLKFLIIL